MKIFFEDYLQNPAQAIENARQEIAGSWFDDIDEEMIYAQLASPEFRLYEAMIFAPSTDDASVRPALYQ